MRRLPACGPAVADPNVYEVAHLKDADDILVSLGVDYDRVTISTGRWESGGGIKLNWTHDDQQEWRRDV